MKCSRCGKECDTGSEIEFKHTAETRCTDCLVKKPTKHQQIQHMNIDEMSEFFYTFSKALIDNIGKLSEEQGGKESHIETIKQYLLEESEE